MMGSVIGIAMLVIIYILYKREQLGKNRFTSEAINKTINSLKAVNDMMRNNETLKAEQAIVVKELKSEIDELAKDKVKLAGECLNAKASADRANADRLNLEASWMRFFTQPLSFVTYLRLAFGNAKYNMEEMYGTFYALVKKFDIEKSPQKGAEFIVAQLKSWVAEEERMNAKDPYVVFGLERGATRDAINKRYRDMIERFHPETLAIPTLAEDGAQYLEKELEIKAQHIDRAWKQFNKLRR